MSCILFVCLLAVVVREARAQDEWTRFRGPDGTGVTAEGSIPVAFTEADYRWNVELPGSGHSSPVLWGDRIFLTCETQKDSRRSVVCLDAADGRVRWSFEDTFEPYRNHKFNSFAASTPAVDADRLYVSWISGTTFIVLALDHDGTLLWRRRMGDFAARFGAGASPIVLDDMVVMANDHAGEESFLVGLDAETGQTRWKVPRESGYASYITPAVYRAENGPIELIFVSPSQGVTGLNPQTGQLNWELDVSFTLKTVASPVLAGELVFTSSGRGSGGMESAVVRRGDAASGRKPELAYTIPSDLPYVPTPVVFNDHVFLWSDRGVVTCIEAATGKQVWQEETGSEFFASPICVDGRLCGVSKEGEVFVIDASAQYNLLARNQLPEGSYATPAVAGGCIYFRTFNRLISIDGKGGN